MSRVNEHGQAIGDALDWAAVVPPPGIRLEGRWCAVEPLVADVHASGLHEAYALDDGSMWTYMPYGPFGSAAEYREWCATVSGRDDPLFRAVVGADGTPLGVASYLRIEPSMGVIEVGHIAWSPQLRRTKAATEAMYLMMRHVFDDLGYRRYEWKCDALNEPSRRAAARLGFTYEGTFRQALVTKGRNRDTAWYSIVDGEWPRLRAGFEAWLDPANFDGAGRQRESLSFASPS